MGGDRTPKLSQLRKIAFRCWDPIGLGPPEPAIDDEYDGYVLHVAGLLQAGRGTDEAARYLIGTERENMGIDHRADATERADTTACAIRNYLDRLKRPPQLIELDASEWRAEADLWNALLAALEAPDWHGNNYDALWDTITEAATFGGREGGTINGVQPPFQIVVTNAESLAPDIAKRLRGIASLLNEARVEFDLDVGLAAMPGQP